MHYTAPDGATQAVDIAGGGDGDHVDRWMILLAKTLQHLESAHVWKVDVQQRKVRSELIDRVQCALAGMHASGDLEAGHPLHVRRVQVGDPEVVIDDQGADQCGEATFSGMRTVKRAPPSLTTLTDPPWRSATCRTSARPKPRRFLPGPSLVLKPSWKI